MVMMKERYRMRENIVKRMKADCKKKGKREP